MDQQQAADVLRNLDLRTRRMEQFLPDLPTRAEMREAIDSSIQGAVAPLATRAELHEAIQAAVAPLATKEELRQGLGDLRDELRRHMDLCPEHITGTAKMALEGVDMVGEKFERRDEELRQRMADFMRRNAQYRLDGTRSFEELRQRVEKLIGTEAKHHAGHRKTFEELRDDLRARLKAYERERAGQVKAVAKLRGRVEKIEAKQPRKRKASQRG